MSLSGQSSTIMRDARVGDKESYVCRKRHSAELITSQGNRIADSSRLRQAFAEELDTRGREEKFDCPV